jgi:hypothetical protein
MSQLKLEHVKVNDLPHGWVKQLPPAQTVTVTIVVENFECKPVMSETMIIESDIRQDDNIPKDREAYLQYLRSQGINIERLDESMKQLEAGSVETVKLDELDDLLDDFIENANTATHT